MSVHEYRSPKTGKFGGFKVCWREDGKQRSRLFETKREADGFDADIKRGLADTRKDAGGDIPFGEFVLERWLPGADLAATTKKNYKSNLKTQLVPLHGRSVAWVACHRSEVQAVLNDCTRASNEAAYHVVKGAMDEAVSLGFIQSHSLAKLNGISHGGKRQIVIATPAQLESIANGLTHPLVLWCCAGLGLRACEALGLRGSDFRDGFKMVRVQRQARSGEAAALKGKPVGFYKDVPVATGLGKLVKAHVRDHGLGALFPGRGHEFMDYSNWEKGFKVLALKAGPYLYADGTKASSNAFTAHQLRHIFASKMLAQGEPASNVAAWIGDTLATLDRTYRHVLPGAGEAARARLDQAWDGPS